MNMISAFYGITFILSTSFLSCINDSKSPTFPVDMRLISYEFNYDPTASQSFQPKPFYQIAGDTINIYDYWALSQQPPYTAQSYYHQDTVEVLYPAILSERTICRFPVNHSELTDISRSATIYDAEYSIAVAS